MVVMIVFVVVAWLAMTWLVVSAVRSDKHSDVRRGRGDGGSESGGGGQPRDNPPNVPSGPVGDPDEPSWWPAFERDFRAYAERQTAGAGDRT